jgi:tetratricopeptide (TPR) repeat protein
MMPALPAIEERRKMTAQLQTASQRLGALYAKEAGVALTRGDWVRAARLLEQAFSQVEDDPVPEAFAWVIAAGDAWAAAGSARASLLAYDRACSFASTFVAADPGNSRWQRDLSLSQNRIGEILAAQGDLAGALQSYEASLAIRQWLVEADPTGAAVQHDLSVTEERIGDTLGAQGNFAGALQSYEASLARRQWLVQTEPTDASRQHGLSIIEERIGDTCLAQGDFSGAFQSYEASLARRLWLVQIEPANSQWRSDLDISYAKLERLRSPGNARMSQGNAL